MSSVSYNDGGPSSTGFGGANTGSASSSSLAAEAIEMEPGSGASFFGADGFKK